MTLSFAEYGSLGGRSGPGELDTPHRQERPMPIGRLHHVIVDCPDPYALAVFWSGLLGDPITYADDDFVVVSASDRASGLAFQRSPDQRPPTWPDPAVPQQLHLDVVVDDV